MTSTNGDAPRYAAAIAVMNVDYEAVTGMRPAGFVCPVCGQNVDPGRATRGHAPAKAVGGKVVTLICDTCNSTFGTRFEAAAVKAIIRRRGIRSGEWNEDIAMGSGQPGRNLINSKVTLRANPATGKTEWHVCGPKVGSPAHRRYLEEVDLIVRAGDGGLFQITTKSATNDVIHRAYMSWAFLAFTGQLGYTFALSEPGRLVAEALLSPTFTLFGASAVLNINNVAPKPDFEPSCPVLTTLDPLPAAADAFGWRYGPVICVFPLRDDATGEIYRKLQARTAVGAWEEVDHEVLRTYLSDPAYAAGGTPGT